MPKLYESRTAQVVRDGVPLVVKQQVRRGVRAYGSATSAHRPMPDYLIIGAKRGGTTSLERYLEQHPGIGSRFPAFQTLKGVYFFDENYQRGERWYRGHFPTAWARRLSALRAPDQRFIVGESSPYYLFHPLAAERAAATAPQTQIIVLLRDPVERAWSHWKASRRGGIESLSFADALAAEEERLAGEEDRIRSTPGYTSVAHRHQSYAAQGRYVHSLPRWLDAFPRSQMLILASERLYQDPQGTVDEVTDFLGLTRWPLRNTRKWGNHADDPERPPVLIDVAAAFVEDNKRLEQLLGTSFEWTTP